MGLTLKKKTWLSVLAAGGIDMKKSPPVKRSTDMVGGLTNTGGGRDRP